MRTRVAWPPLLPLIALSEIDPHEWLQKSCQSTPFGPDKIRVEDSKRPRNKRKSPQLLGGEEDFFGDI